MPPKKENRSTNLVQNACCFCQRPADDSITGDLAVLISCKTGNKGIKYHEACAAYSLLIAKSGPKHGQIQDWVVGTEAIRGKQVLCEICRKPGATVTCSAACCSRSYHLPCAREAAMGTAPTKINDEVRPFFAAAGDSSRGSGSQALACREHREAISNPLQEPAGLWFEAYGGWACQCSAAGCKTGPGVGEYGSLDVPVTGINGTGSSDQTQVATLENMGSTAAGTVAATSVPTLEAAHATPPPEVAAHAAEAAEDFSFDIPGHQWEVAACVQGPLPPLRPGEGRVLGVTLSSRVHAAFKTATSTFLAAAARDPTLRHIVPLQEPSDSFSKKGLNKIASGLKHMIYKDAMGVRVRADAPILRKFEILGVYGGLQLFAEDYELLQDDRKLALSVGLRCEEQLVTRLESYAADEELVMKGVLAAEDGADTSFVPPIPEARHVWDATNRAYIHKHSWLVTTAFLYGNVTCLINDPTINPFADRSVVAQAAAPELLKEPNCKMISCLVFGWPFIVLVSISDIKPGQELLYLYNGHVASFDGYWSNMREKCRAEMRALQRLDKLEEANAKLRRMERFAREQRSSGVELEDSAVMVAAVADPDASAVIGGGEARGGEEQGVGAGREANQSGNIGSVSSGNGEGGAELQKIRDGKERPSSGRGSMREPPLKHDSTPLVTHGSGSGAVRGSGSSRGREHTHRTTPEDLRKKDRDGDLRRDWPRSRSRSRSRDRSRRSRSRSRSKERHPLRTEDYFVSHERPIKPSSRSLRSDGGGRGGRFSFRGTGSGGGGGGGRFSRGGRFHPPPRSGSPGAYGDYYSGRERERSRLRSRSRSPPSFRRNDDGRCRHAAAPEPRSTKDERTRHDSRPVGKVHHASPRQRNPKRRERSASPSPRGHVEQGKNHSISPDASLRNKKKLESSSGGWNAATPVKPQQQREKQNNKDSKGDDSSGFKVAPNAMQRVHATGEEPPHGGATTQAPAGAAAATEPVPVGPISRKAIEPIPTAPATVPANKSAAKQNIQQTLTKRKDVRRQAKAEAKHRKKEMKEINAGADPWVEYLAQMSHANGTARPLSAGQGYVDLNAHVVASVDGTVPGQYGAFYPEWYAPQGYPGPLQGFGEMALQQPWAMGQAVVEAQPQLVYHPVAGWYDEGLTEQQD